MAVHSGCPQPLLSIIRGSFSTLHRPQDGNDITSRGVEALSYPLSTHIAVTESLRLPEDLLIRARIRRFHPMHLVVTPITYTTFRLRPLCLKSSVNLFFSVSLLMCMEHYGVSDALFSVEGVSGSSLHHMFMSHDLAFRGFFGEIEMTDSNREPDHLGYIPKVGEKSSSSTLDFFFVIRLPMPASLASLSRVIFSVYLELS
ncbi:hypothetical protein Tco_0149394 [Tanacetum coccineum]